MSDLILTCDTNDLFPLLPSSGIEGLKLVSSFVQGGGASN